MNVRVTSLTAPPPEMQSLEIVECKGIGHPDTICDALAETFSRNLSRFYLDRFGAILHHNVDKALLCGGAARPAYGGGEVVAPIEIHLAGRATCQFRGVRTPVEEIAIEGSREWLRRNLLNLDVERDVRIVPHIRPTSPDLADLFRRGAETGSLLANDTSFGVGFAPFDTLERTVLAVARKLTAETTRSACPFMGEDVKVMGARHGEDIELTVACAFVGRHVRNRADYRAGKAQIQRLALDIATSIAAVPPRILVNAADRDDTAGGAMETDGIYLTVTGLSAEAGDDGQVGRGNRVNGLITPYRPMSLEAAAGKNPVTHVGKLYNVMAGRVAAAIVAGVADVQDAYCYLLSRIGHPIDMPTLFDVKVRLHDSQRLESLAPRIAESARAAFENVDSVWRDAVSGALQVW